MASFAGFSRRQLLKASVSAAAAPVVVASSALSQVALALAGEGPVPARLKPQMKLSYMTFVCPDWTLETLLRFARQVG